MTLEIPGKTKPYVMAHRGVMAHYPENTPVSFQQAIEAGADLLETDLHITADGVIVCIHDVTVDRTTDGSGAVREMTLEDIKALSAHNGMAAYQGERVPTLVELFEMTPAEVIIAVELKTDDFLKGENARRLVNVIVGAGRGESCVLLSFKLARVQAVAWAAQEAGISLPTGFITLKRVVPNPDAALQGPFWPILLVNPFYVAMAHRRRQVVCPLDPTPDSRLWYYRLLGVDAVLTNNAEATLRALGR